MNLFLNKEQLEELTGYKYSSSQIKWLKKNGFSPAINAAGKPKVMTSSIYNKFGQLDESNENDRPNFESIK